MPLIRDIVNLFEPSKLKVEFVTQIIQVFFTEKYSNSAISH